MEFAGERLHKSALESNDRALPSRLYNSPAADAWPQVRTSTPNREIVRELFALRLLLDKNDYNSRTIHKKDCGRILAVSSPGDGIAVGFRRSERRHEAGRELDPC